MEKIRLIIIIAMLLPKLSFADHWATAEQAIKKIELSDTLGLKASDLRSLHSLGCSIPQSFEASDKVENIVSGELAHAGQKDIAVLCSAKGYSQIVVLWGGDIQCPSIIKRSRNSTYLQYIGPNPDDIGYSRLITESSVVRLKKYINHWEQEDVLSFPTHSGLEDHFLGKSSSIYYCKSGSWITLAGGD
ncbi:hypothetical protein HJ051_23530 [Vibrio parahaemolyticus]|nr:hypothetical protein [Vibrio parahaemolyticus]